MESDNLEIILSRALCLIVCNLYYPSWWTHEAEKVGHCNKELVGEGLQIKWKYLLGNDIPKDVFLFQNLGPVVKVI